MRHAPLPLLPQKNYAYKNYSLDSCLLKLLLERCHSDLQTGLFLVGIVEQFPGFVQFGLEHGLDLGGFLAPLGLELLQFIGQASVLGFQEPNLLDVAGEALVQILHVSLFLFTALLDVGDAAVCDGGVGTGWNGHGSIVDRPLDAVGATTSESASHGSQGANG